MANTTGGPGRGVSVKNMSVADLEREITRRRKQAGRLMRQRAALLRRLSALDAKIAAAGGRAGKAATGGVDGRSRRFKNSMSLVEALTKVLTGKTMGVTEAAEAAKKAGYRTVSPAFRTIVNQALIASGKFKRVSRGQYTAK